MNPCIKTSGGTCSAVGCSMRRGTNLLSQVKMFSFPRNPVRRKAWELALRRKDWTPTNYSLLCSSHFISGRPSKDPSDPDYTPSIFAFNKPAVQRDQSKVDQFKKNAVHARVTAASRSDMGKSPGMRDLDEDWVPPGNINLKNRSAKARLPKTYSKIDDTCLSDGGETSKQKKILMHQKISMSIPENARSLLRCSDDSSESFSANIYKKNAVMNLKTKQDLSSMKENFTYKNLLKNLLLIKKPNNFWGVTAHSNAIICARWSENYTCEKKVVIEDSLTVRAFLKDWEMNLSELMSITCINDLSNLLEKVESYKIIKFQDL